MSSQLSRERRQKSSSCNGIFQLRIVLLHYCVWVDLFVVYMLPIFTGNVPGPLPLTHTASNEKLGEGLGTRLQIACVWLCLVCEVDFSEDAVFSFRAMFLASSCSFNVTLFRVFIFLPMQCCVGGTSIQVYCAWCPIVKICCVRGTGIEVCFAGLWTVIYGPASWAGEGLSCL